MHLKNEYELFGMEQCFSTMNIRSHAYASCPARIPSIFSYSQLLFLYCAVSYSIYMTYVGFNHVCRDNNSHHYIKQVFCTTWQELYYSFREENLARLIKKVAQ
jgi:hypothetical protein